MTLISLEIFLKAIGLYLLFTLPAFVLPLMYAISAFYACIFGWAAWLVFLLCLRIIIKIESSTRLKWFILSSTIPVAVAIAHHLIGIFNVDIKVWAFSPFLVFPALAVIAGWISLYSTRKAIHEYFEPTDETILLTTNSSI